MEPYKGNRYPFCYALFAKADAQEAVAVLNALERGGVRSALPVRRSRDCIARAAAVLLFLSPEGVRDEAVQRGVAQACAAGKTILTIYLRETELTPGLSLQLGQTQGILKYREASDADFFRKLFDAPALRTMSVTPQQKRVLRRRTLLWAISGALVLALGVLIGLNWRPVKAMLPNSTFRRVGVPWNFNSVETLYVYGETLLDRYELPRYQLFADGEHDWVRLKDGLIPQGDIRTLDDFSLLRNLRELCICNNPIPSIEPILSLTQLTLLDVSHDPIADFSGIGALSRLETLNVSCAPLASLEGIRDLKRLRILDLSYTDLASLEGLLSLPALEIVYIDGGQLAAAEALGETPFEIVCRDTPVHGYAELAAALQDPAVTDIRIMNGFIIPAGAELIVRPGVALTGVGSDDSFTVSNYGTVRLGGVWEMGLCSRINYGTIVVEDGGLYTGGMCSTISTGTFRIEKGGRQNLERGASFSLSGGSYENDGDVYLDGGYQLRFLGGTVVNNGSIHVRSTEHGELVRSIDRDKFVNNGTLYYKGVQISEDKLFSNDED